MYNIGLKTEAKKCRKCGWCAEYDDYDVIANTHTPVYYCTVKDFYSKRKPEMVPNPDGECLCYIERGKEDEGVEKED
jgi:hypothetical protein